MPVTLSLQNKNDRSMMKNLLLPFCPFVLAAGLQAQVSVQLQPVATGLPEVVGLAHAGDARLFCVLSPGTIRIIDDGVVLPTPFLNITSQVVSGGERGLLGLAFHPSYAENGLFYVHYTTGSPLTSRVSRFSVSPTNPDSALVDSQLIIYETTQPAGNHNGGDLQFGPDGYLYISLGDGGGAGDGANNAQTLSNPLGALLRIDINVEEGTYAIPPTNPFVDHPTAVPEIWAYGLRNPWRVGFDS
jgi:glucose/arabinose dehydrogenase